ncbi:hypothetical protein J715_2210 [Acinetobacter baumannii 1571545]|nr:hypothetical protein J715_3009 [Acinetobacter baumannii 1571545]KCY48161.1 hypothetical protein J715_2912 [Acinetobacter baumannii 1571545]KCY48997.1 hypothetical protein J715_2210 [Acinetobacter baumannii 1571545]
MRLNLLLLECWFDLCKNKAKFLVNVTVVTKHLRINQKSGE